MKKLFLALFILCLIPSMAFAALSDTGVSSNTVSFNTVTPVIVSFNSVTNYIRIINRSPADCYVDLKCRDANNGRGYFKSDNTSDKMLLPGYGTSSPNSVSINFSTSNLGFISTQGDGTVYYTVTGEGKDI